VKPYGQQPRGTGGSTHPRDKCAVCAEENKPLKSRERRRGRATLQEETALTAPLTSEEVEDLNPGCRRLVQFLRSAGFETFDSGDGVTHEFTNDNDCPYVAMRVSKFELADETDRLFHVLKDAGIVTERMNSDNTKPTIQVTYAPYVWDNDPDDDLDDDLAGELVLFNVTDAMLPPEKT